MSRLERYGIALVMLLSCNIARGAAHADQTVWFPPVGSVTGANIIVDAASANPPQAFHIRRVSGTGVATGVATFPLAIATDQEIDSLIVCYEVLSGGSAKILATRLIQMREPITPTTVYADTIGRNDPMPSCYAVDVASFPVEGALFLQLDVLVFSNTTSFHYVEIGAIGLKMGTFATVGLRDVPAPAASSAVRLAHRPNPFAERSRIEYHVSVPGQVRLEIFDTTGRAVRTLVDAPRPVGEHGESWDGRDETGREVAAGVYLARLSLPSGERAARRLTLVR